MPRLRWQHNNRDNRPQSVTDPDSDQLSQFSFLTYCVDLCCRKRRPVEGNASKTPNGKPLVISPCHDLCQACHRRVPDISIQNHRLGTRRSCSQGCASPKTHDPSGIVLTHSYGSPARRICGYLKIPRNGTLGSPKGFASELSVLQTLECVHPARYFLSPYYKSQSRQQSS